MNNLKTKNINNVMGGLDPKIMNKIFKGSVENEPHFISDITPEAAKYILERKPDPRSKINRPLDLRHVSEYEMKMKNGHYELNGDTFRFDWFGSLQDGQHRLHAIVNTGISLRSQIFVSGLNPEAFSTIDTGMAKKDKDIFYAMGVENPNKIAPIIALHRSWFGLNNPNNWKEVDEGYRGLTTRKSYSTSQYFAKLFYNDLSESEKRSIQEAIIITQASKNNLMSSGSQWIGATCLAFSVLKIGNQNSSLVVREFFKDVSNPYPHLFNPRFPVKKLIDKIQDEWKKSKETMYKFTPSMKNELLLRAWNAYASDKLLSKGEMDADYTDKVPKIKRIGVSPYTRKKMGNR